MPLLDHVVDLVIADLVHVVHLLERFQSLDADEGLTEWNRPEPAVEVEHVLLANPQELSDVCVCRQSGGETDDTDHLLRRFNLIAFRKMD